ncbi:MAG: type I-C CRISPR-associated protein Cas5c [Clostridiales bacterium]|nr:type I-C CRISPR-associated protein Cas5c [Clostridiales bacterium]
MFGSQVEFKVSGEKAFFPGNCSKEETEMISKPIPTYEALRGIVENSYWKPTITWLIDAVCVMNPIQMERRNELQVNKYTGSCKSVQYTYLRDVCYLVKAHFEWNMARPDMAGDRNVKKHQEIAVRSIKKGGRREIFLGKENCQGYVEPCNFDEEKAKSAYKDIPMLAFEEMFHHVSYKNKGDSDVILRHYWQPIMCNGIILFQKPEEYVVKEKFERKSHNKIS